MSLISRGLVCAQSDNGIVLHRGRGVRLGMQRLHLLGASVEIFAQRDSLLAPSPAIAAARTEILD